MKRHSVPDSIGSNSGLAVVAEGCSRSKSATLLALGAAVLFFWGTSARAFTNLVQNASYEVSGGAGQFQGPGFWSQFCGSSGCVPPTSVSNWTVTGMGLSIASIRDNHNLTQLPTLASAPLPLATQEHFIFKQMVMLVAPTMLAFPKWTT